MLARSVSPVQLRGAGAAVRDDGVKRSLADWLRFPEVDENVLQTVEPELTKADRSVLDEAVQDHRYAPYLQRQDVEMERMRSDGRVTIPPMIDYRSIAGLSNEMIERLSLARPATIGEASRIRGITPAALAAILVHSKRKAA